MFVTKSWCSGTRYKVSCKNGLNSITFKTETTNHTEPLQKSFLGSEGVSLISFSVASIGFHLHPLPFKSWLSDCRILDKYTSSGLFLVAILAT